MKFKSAFILVFLMSTICFAQDFNNEYAKKAYNDYLKSKESAMKLNDAIDSFLNDTSEKNLELARIAWVNARKDYSVTEIYRFYGGPIDDDQGPEGLINSWPLDEAYIDYVKGNSKSGIINQINEYPQITKDLLISLNEKDGEKNISTGWHAIEFLLWGQDFNINGPGERKANDFEENKSDITNRRRTYLKIISDLLVENLDEVVKKWDPSDTQSYYHTFINLPEPDSLTKAFTSLISMSGEELAIERMFVAYDTQFQEDEHSCFSDTTHLDLLYNFIGVKNLWSLISENEIINDNLITKIDDNISLIENELVNFKAPFDRAIFAPDGRAQMILIIDKLQETGELFKQAAGELGIIL